MKERYPETDIVYVKSSQTSDFRKGFGLIKSRTFNDLHHAKDAYICIVAGNAYCTRFTRFGFDTNQKYSLNTDAIFGSDPRSIRGIKYWDGTRTIEKVKNTLSKNNAHCTKYAFCRNGGVHRPAAVSKGRGPDTAKGKPAARKIRRVQQAVDILLRACQIRLRQ